MLEPLLSAVTAGDETRAERAARDLGAAGPAALTELAALLNHDDADHRWWAVRALGEIDDPAVEPLFRQALHDPDLTVRQCAARALIARKAPGLIPDLIDCLFDGDPLLTRLAGCALAGAGKEAVPNLIEIIQKGPQLARIEAVKALAEIQDPRAIPVFFHAVQEGDSPLVEHWAEIGLENLGVGMTFFEP